MVPEHLLSRRLAPSPPPRCHRSPPATLARLLPVHPGCPRNVSSPEQGGSPQVQTGSDLPRGTPPADAPVPQSTHRGTWPVGPLLCSLLPFLRVTSARGQCAPTPLSLTLLKGGAPLGPAGSQDHLLHRLGTPGNCGVNWE